MAQWYLCAVLSSDVMVSLRCAVGNTGDSYRPQYQILWKNQFATEMFNLISDLYSCCEDFILGF